MRILSLSPIRFKFSTIIEANSLPARARTLVAQLITLAMVNVCAAGAFGSSAIPVSTPSGLIKTDGIVTINGSRARSGQTIFSNSSIRTEIQSESLINFDQARFRLKQQTDLNLAFSSSELSGYLREGEIDVSVVPGLRAEIETGDASVTANPAQGATFAIRVEACSTRLSVQTGQVEVRVWNRVRTVRARESFSTAESVPPLPPQNLSQRKQVGLFIGIGVAVGVLVIVLTGHHDQPETEDFGGCVIVSGERGC